MRTSIDRSMEDDEHPRLSTNQKSLKINLDEAFGRLFTKDLRIYVHPLRDPAIQEITTVQNIKMPGDLHSLYCHLVERGRIKQRRFFGYREAEIPEAARPR